MRSNEQLVWRHNHSDGSYSAVGHAINFLIVNPGRTLLCYYDLIIMADLSQQVVEFNTGSIAVLWMKNQNVVVSMIDLACIYYSDYCIGNDSEFWRIVSVSSTYRCGFYRVDAFEYLESHKFLWIICFTARVFCICATVIWNAKLWSLNLILLLLLVLVYFGLYIVSLSFPVSKSGI